MKVSNILGSVILATSVQGSVLLRRDTTEPDVLEPPASLVNLVETAKEQVISEVAETEAKLRKRGIAPTCTPSKLYFRRE